MTVNDRIKELRTNAGMTQEELANKIEVSRNSLAKWELRTEPGYEYLKKIAEHFKVTVDWLMTGKEQQGKTETLLLTDGPGGSHTILDITSDKQLQEIINNYYKLSPRGQKSIKRFVEITLLDEEQAAVGEAKHA